MWHFYQPLLAKLPIILHHAGAIIVQVSWIYDHITVYPECFTQQSNMSSRRSHASTKAETCSFDFVMGFCRSFSCVTSNPHTYQIARNLLYVCNIAVCTKEYSNSYFVIQDVLKVTLLRFYSHSGKKTLFTTKYKLGKCANDTVIDRN